MRVCKKCGEIANSNTYVAGYYCEHCGNLGFDEVYSEIDIYKEWVDYRYLCYSPKEIKERLELLKRLYEAVNKLDYAYLDLSQYNKYLTGEEYDEINDVIADVQEYLEQM